MTKNKLINIQTRHEYEVTDLGKIVFFTLGDYISVWFFNSDGTVDEENPPQWTLKGKGY